MVSVFAVVFLGIIFGVALLMFTGIYNGLQGIKKQVERNWEAIDHYLQNRDAEIPRLLNLILHEAPQEKVLVEKVRKHKEKSAKIKNLAQKIKHANEMTNLLSSLMLVGDAYPELRTNMEFKKLRSVLLKIEQQLVNRQEHFNSTIRVFNHKCSQFPDVIFAQTLGYSSLDNFIVYREEVQEQAWDFKVAA